MAKTVKTRALLHRPPRKRGARPRSHFRRAKPAASSTLDSAALYRLMTWLSPAYPVGGFAYSTGIEWAVEAGDIHDAETLRRWIEAMLIEGAGRSDAIFFSQAHRAAHCGNDAALTEVAALAATFAPTRERWSETTTLGRAFLEVTCAAWPCGAILRLSELWRGPVAYPVAVAVACAGHHLPLAWALQGFLAAVAANWASAGMRLIPLGHTEGQRVLHALESSLMALTRQAMAASLDDLGTATFRADLASIKHETQHTRLFRS